MSHGALLTIDLAALQHNWKLLAARAHPAECAACVKADAYGIGLEPAVAALAKAGCKTFFVAHDNEARQMPTVQDKVRTFVLNGIASSSSSHSAPKGSIAVIGSFGDIIRLNRYANSSSSSVKVALHFNIGMNRLGFEAHEIDAVKAALGVLRPVLIMGHFSSSEDIVSPSTERELEIFARIRAAFPDIPASLANSSGHFLDPVPKYDLTRPGYALYGGNPTPHLPNPMKPVVALSTPILLLRAIAAGETVGYNNLWTAKRPTILATCSIGYADGLPRSARGTDVAQGGAGFINGIRCPIVGGISMDLTVFDVTDVPPPLRFEGAMVEILGPHQSIDDLAASANTIGYEILTRLGHRYKRTYLDADQKERT